MSFEYEQKKQAYDSCALGLESNISKIEQVSTNLGKIYIWQSNYIKPMYLI